MVHKALIISVFIHVNNFAFEPTPATPYYYHCITKAATNGWTVGHPYRQDCSKRMDRQTYRPTGLQRTDGQTDIHIERVATN